jgi:hypothetical protein
MHVPVETGSRHVGQQVIGDDGLAVALIAPAMHAWQYTCPRVGMLTLRVRKLEAVRTAGESYR